MFLDSQFNRFVFLRHGESTANREGIRSGGDSDPPLSERGVAQAHEAGWRLRQSSTPPRVILVAPLSRTIETAQIIAPYIEADLQMVPELKERFLGSWNGLDLKETPLLPGHEPPGGEDEATFRSRVYSALQRVGECLSQRPLVISSRGVARVLCAMAATPPVMTPLHNGQSLLFTVRYGNGRENGWAVCHVEPPSSEHGWAC